MDWTEMLRMYGVEKVGIVDLFCSNMNIMPENRSAGPWTATADS